jgi:hypothetical protein
MARQQKVGNALADGVLVAAAAADELALHDLRLHEQVVQVLELLLVGLQFLCRRGLLWQGREAELLLLNISLAIELKTVCNPSKVFCLDIASPLWLGKNGFEIFLALQMPCGIFYPTPKQDPRAELPSFRSGKPHGKQPSEKEN